MRNSGIDDGGTDPGPGPAGGSRGALGGGGSRGGVGGVGGGASPQIARYPEMVKRALGLKSAPAWGVPPAILATWLLNAAGRPEEDFLRGERRYMGQIAGGPVAAQFSFCRIENPRADQLVVVESVWIVGVAGQTDCISTQRSTGVGAVAGDTRAMDGRTGGQASTGCDLRSGTRVGATTLGLRSLVEAGRVDRVQLGAVLPGGWSVDVEHQTANTAVNVGFIFRVISIDPSELTGATP